jgi:hypothetical protein
MVEARGHRDRTLQSKPWTLREFSGKTVWDWLQLLIIPLALVGITLVFDLRQQELENQRAESERELEEQRAQDAALQAYLDQMSTLLLEKNLRNAEAGGEVRTLARARTLTVLRTLDPNRKRQVIQFVAEAKLIQTVEGREPIIKLGGADLSGDTDLRHANLSGADGWTEEQLAATESLEGATMPNGQKYEDWLKSKGSGENTGAS